jgi:2-dehydropantoate 2-reductase
MRILILGAGALGGYFGARLLAAGRDVTFLVRPNTAQMLAQGGLRVISPTHGDVFIAHPPTVLATDVHAGYDLILLTAKAYDLDAAIESIAPAVGAGTSILPLLNGMAHMARLDKRFGAEKVLGGTSYISSERRADGVIHHLNELETINFGDRFEPEGTRIQTVAAALGDAGFTTQLRPLILQEMWNKWASLATLAGMTCLMRASISDIAAVGGAPLSIKLYEECAAIAAAEGFAPSAKTVADRRIFFTNAPMTASMLRDLEAGGRIEANHILGDLLERGRKHELAAPMLEIAYAHVRCYEERRNREKGVSV